MNITRKNIFLGLIGMLLCFGLTSATAPSSSTPEANLNNPHLQEYLETGKHKHLKEFATELKGEELTLKEKIGLRLFGKKIKKIQDAEGNAAEGKSQVVALVLALILGLGIHRFYLGYTWQGIVQLLTLGGCGIWALIDIIRIATGDLKPNGGEYAKTL